MRDLGNKDVMILKHHGLLTVGRTVSEAFLNMYLLEQSCRVQIAATQGGQRITLPHEKIADHTAEQFQREGYNRNPRPWAALKRRLDRLSPGYAT